MEKPNYSLKDFIFVLFGFGSFPFTAFVNNYIFNIFGKQVTVFEMLRLMDESDDQDKCFFEIRIVVDEITKDVSLMVTDFAYSDEVEESKMIWESQIADLKKLVGSS